MNFRKFTLPFIIALAVSCMAVETAWVKTAMALPAPANLTASVTGNKVTVSWGAVDGATGYKVYYGFSSGVYGSNVDVGNVTSRSFDNEPDGIYYVAVTAYDGVSESGYSNEVVVSIPDESYVFERLWPTLPQPWHFAGQSDVAVDDKENLYIVSEPFDNVQKFDSDGNFITRWGSKGSGDGQFDGPVDIALDNGGNVYVTDRWNHRIQKFDSDGKFITKWRSKGSGDGQFKDPAGITVDSDGNVYVTDSNNHIQKFDSDVNFITKWGSSGHGNGQFRSPTGITVDSNVNVYVADTWNHRIQKFNSDGTFITKWGSKGGGDGQFDSPLGITVDINGNVYVADTKNDRIQKFDSDGNFITKWGTRGRGNGQFVYPAGITVDSNGNVYVSGNFNNRIQKFDSDGNYITTVGTLGFSPGQVNLPLDLAVHSNGGLYIADTDNDRIQVFKKGTLLSNSKAIIVAGGGPFSGNNLWSTTQTAANYTYNTLTYQGYTKETIYYLTSDTDLDLDSNGLLDDVDADATNSNLQEAVTTWALNADDVVIYLIDHGGKNTFRMSGTEVLDAVVLNTWLNEMQQTITGKIIIVYDACEAGSFMANLSSGNQNRIVITSTSPGENAYFISNGTISFSRYFWTQVLQKNNLTDAFTVSRVTMGILVDNQTPLLDANSDGIGNTDDDMSLASKVFIGTKKVVDVDAPVIGSVSPEQKINGTNSATLYADGVTDTDGISRVWAVIIPPDFRQGQSGNPIQDLPSINFAPVGNGRYKTVFNDFTKDGIYNISIFAMDGQTYTSPPLHTTVTVNSPLNRKAIIVAGGSQTDQIWTAVERNAALAYETLKFQGYNDEDIYYMSAATTTGVDVMATLDNIDFAINTWAHVNTLDLVIYLIGDGGDNTFKVNDTDTLQAAGLDNWLDNLQSAMPGNVTVIYDAPLSGSFISSLIPPSDKNRIAVCSTDAGGPAHFLSGGDISFSRFFWQQIANGDSVYGSFVRAKGFISGQSPQLDDTGNGMGNENSDGLFSSKYYLGTGIILAGDAPLTGSVSPEQTLTGGSPSAVIWADDVTTTGVIDRVWAVITPPNFSLNTPDTPILDMPSIDLADVGNNRYEAAYISFTGTGTYNITIYAMDTLGNISDPKTTTVISNQTGNEVVPGIKANGSGEDITITNGDLLKVTISLNPGPHNGDGADWWLLVNTPFPSPNEWYYYDLSQGWTPGLFATYQGPLSDLSTYEILNMPTLPTGDYGFYFGVDMNMDGTLDTDQLFYDEVGVVIEN